LATRQGALGKLFHTIVHSQGRVSPSKNQNLREKIKQRKGFTAEFSANWQQGKGLRRNFSIQLYTPNEESHRQNQKLREKINKEEAFKAEISANWQQHISREGGDWGWIS
jgi:hypothetical protein